MLARGMVSIFHANGSRLLASLRGHAGSVRDVAFSPDDKQLVSCGSDGAVLIYNVFHR